MNIIEFIEARLDEDEAMSPYFCEGVDEYRGCALLSDRMLREVETKRAILAEHATEEFPVAWHTSPEDVELRVYPVCKTCNAWFGRFGACPTVRAVASVWSDHPDYDPAWAVTS